MLLRYCEGALGQCLFSVGCNSSLVLFLLVAATTTRSLLLSWSTFFSCRLFFFLLPAFSFCEKKNASNSTTQATYLVVVAFTIDQLAMKMNQAGVGVGDAQVRVVVGAAAADDDDAAAASVGGGCVRDEMIERRDNSNRCCSSNQEIGTAVVLVAAAGRAGFQAVVSDSVVATAPAPATESENTPVNSIVTESSIDENKAVEEVEEDEDEEQEEEEKEEQEDDEEEEQEEGRIDEHEEEDNDDSGEEASEEEEEEEEQEQEQKKQVLESGSKPTVVVTGRILLAPSGNLVMTNDGMLDLVSDVAGYMEDDSRSHSENGIGAIGGGMTRTGEDNRERSRRHLEDVDLIDWEAPTPTPSQSEREREHRPLFQELGLMDSDVVTEEASGKEGRRIHEKTDSLVVSMSAAAAAGEEDKEEETAAAIVNNNTRSIGKEAQGSFRKPSSSAYTRALSRIFKSKSPSSERSPVLSGRNSPIAQKLDAEAGEYQVKNDAKKEKKEVSEEMNGFPESYADTKEKGLTKLASRGVVKFFSAISRAQKVPAGADSRDARVIAKQSQSGFLSPSKSPGYANVQSTLTSGRGRLSQPASPLQFATVESHQRDFPPTSHWSVVQENFMLGREKQQDQEEEFGGLEGQNMIGNQVANGPGDDISEDDDNYDDDDDDDD
ncbi:unnamed protein product [Sphagnum jensenii]|uniref:Uncharacterized protein n=1 Tax=Sphagnum jensenii TaxID=128206 RepID=A0ABP1AE10_9BRYO